MTDNEKELFLDALESLGYRGFDGKRYYTEDTSYPSPEKILKALLAQEYPDSIPAEIKFKLATIRMDKKYSALYPLLKEIEADTGKAKLPEVSLEAKQNPEIYQGLTPFYDISSRNTSLLDSIYLVDIEKEQVMWDIGARGYFSATGLNPEEFLKDQKYHMKFEYDITKGKFLYKSEYGGKPITCINMYPIPKWMKLQATPRIPEKIEKFLNHLMPEEKARNYAFDWAYWFLTSRVDTALVLAGKKGVGKDIFALLLSALIGHDQVEKVGQAFFEEKFTGPMDKKRLVHADEVSLISLEAKNKFKRILNSSLSIEAKGQDARTKINTASILMTCNNPDELGVEPDDRRFSIVEITELPLKRTMKEKEIDELVQGLTEMNEEYLQYIAEFGQFILSRKVNYSRTTPYKEEYFYKITLDSLSNWKREIFDFLVLKYKGEGGPFKLSAAARSGTKGVQRKAVTSFLDSFHFMNEYRLGTVVYSSDDRVKDILIEPNMEFIKYVRSMDLKKLGIKLTKSEVIDSKPIMNKKTLSPPKPQEDGDLL